MIDIDAFAEWVVAKAGKRGVALDEQNLRHARDAVERALSHDGDDVHVALTLSGSAGPVQIEERMTRMAVEVLFPKVEHHAHEPAYKPTPAPKHVERPRREEKEKEKEEAAAKGPPWSLVFALVAIVAFLLLTLFVEREKHRHESPSDDDKHEMHHH